MYTYPNKCLALMSKKEPFSVTPEWKGTYSLSKLLFPSGIPTLIYELSTTTHKKQHQINEILAAVGESGYLDFYDDAAM